MLSPLPTNPGYAPESGVAEYTAALVSRLELPVTVLAQQHAALDEIGVATVARVWKPSLFLPLRIKAALDRVKPDILHVQHEFNLYGGLIQGMLLTALVALVRRRGIRTATTVHGIVSPDDVTKSFLSRNRLPGSVDGVRRAFALAYRAIDASSDLLVVHHNYFRDVLTNQYHLEPDKVIVIPHGTHDPSQVHRGERDEPFKNVLCLGFLAGYKLPELLVEVAESSALPQSRFSFCVGLNPRLNDRAYRDRYRQLERRVQALSPRASWRGFIPDEALPATLMSADVLVLPYTECVSVSGVSALARRWRVPVCYSQALRPLFGQSPLEFALNARALSEAIERAFVINHETGSLNFISWGEAALATQSAWQRLYART